MINDEAEKSFQKAQEIIDKHGLSRKARHECDLMLEKIEKMKGVYKIVGVKWLLSENTEILTNEFSELGNDLYQDVKVNLLESGIDITQLSPLFGSTIPVC